MNAELIAADPALIQNDALLAAVFASSGDCIKILDLDGRLQFMSEGGKRVMEVDDFSALKGCPWPDLWADAGNLAAHRAVAEARDGKTAHFTGAANTAKGNPRFWDVQVVPIRGADGRPTHLLSISKDITEAKAAADTIVRLAEEQRRGVEAEASRLRESRLRLQLALSAARMGVWECRVVADRFVDLTGDDRALVLLGGSPGEQSSFEMFVSRIHPEDRPALGPAAAAALAPGSDGVLDLEYRVTAHGDAPERWVHARAQTLETDDGMRLIGTVRDISTRKEAEAQQHLLSGELQHRIKNTLAMVSAIASQTLRGDDIAERRAAFTARLGALARAHTMLMATTWTSAPLRQVLDGALGAHKSGEGSFRISGEDIELSPRQALSMALTMHELATNAAKYGALSIDEGVVSIAWTTDGQRPDGQPLFRFVWRESGGPLVAEPERRGFGTQVITRVLAADFNGEVRIDYEPGGVVCTLTAPLEGIRPTH